MVQLADLLLGCATSSSMAQAKVALRQHFGNRSAQGLGSAFAWSSGHRSRPTTGSNGPAPPAAQPERWADGQRWADGNGAA